MADDNSWVFDSLVCFLHGPVWNAPLQTFIEDKSIIFDPNLKPDEQNPEFRRVHDEYKNLVDYMLGTFMDEMHITPEQFEFACLEGEGDANTFSFHQGLFQQIWAANDIRIFIRMMTQRNVEIQLQALDLIERRQASQASQDGGEGGPEEGEGSTDTEVEIEQHIIKSVDDEVKENPMAAGSLVPNGPVGEDGTTLDEVAEASDKFQRLNLFFDQDKVNNDDMRVRQEYLRAQRDKILQIKKQARARQLNETIRKNPAERPASAQVAQKILEGGPDGTEPPESSMQLRKMLAQRLRNEVIEKE
ncbi:conserved hypothetical protein [Culex quinquefasciatus]|uniref:Cilia- and flagella-associated protein 36 n=1 Tax=Culex quinquefasciatus TaxID=7176 RepID=B0WXI2_CULQU|nr:conserved hypothetical protein [Culex quinquefasciatus]|eukprot:XP_001862104.1 conserved hypothetical protein [Culex quinquefasciatus]